MMNSTPVSAEAATQQIEVLAGLGGHPLDSHEELKVIVESFQVEGLDMTRSRLLRILKVLPGLWSDNIRSLCARLIEQGAGPEDLAELFLDDLEEGWTGSWISPLVNDLSGDDDLELVLWSEVPESLAFGMNDAGLPNDLVLPLIRDHGYPLEMCAGLMEDITINRSAGSAPAEDFDSIKETARIFGVSPRELFEESESLAGDPWHDADF